jgi:hypothetical protein
MSLGKEIFFMAASEEFIKDNLINRENENWSKEN